MYETDLDDGTHFFGVLYNTDATADLRYTRHARNERFISPNIEKPGVRPLENESFDPTLAFGSGIDVAGDATQLGQNTIRYGTNPPPYGRYKIGDIVFNTAAVAEGNAGWICVEAGSVGYTPAETTDTITETDTVIPVTTLYGLARGQRITIDTLPGEYTVVDMFLHVDLADPPTSITISPAAADDVGASGKLVTLVPPQMKAFGPIEA